MRALAIVHERDAGPGVFLDAFEARGIDLDQWFIAEGAEAPGGPTGYGAVISFGGAMNIDQESRHPWLAWEKGFLREVMAAGTPVLGVCLGGQLVAEAAGAHPRRASAPEIGWFAIELTQEGRADPVIGGLSPAQRCFQWHSYEFPLPPDAVALARSPVCLQAFRVGDAVWGIQFHAEVTEADATSWIRNYGVDEDAVRIGVEPEPLEAETHEKISAWNAAGRELCGRFLDLAARRGS